MHEKIEKEAKFYVRDLKKMEHLIKDFGGRVVQPRIFESNLRFDTHERKLSTSHQVLRLRQDTRARLTYKEPADPNSEVSARLEYEVEIDNLTTARHILEVLGFEVITIYEKYRASYFLDEVEISLDEMPFGKFMEIEGADTQHIQKMADKLVEKDGIFRDSLVGNIQELTKLLPKLNVTDDKDLTKLCRDVEQKLCRYPADELRKNRKLRSETAYQANAITEAMAGHMGTGQQRLQQKVAA